MMKVFEFYCNDNEKEDDSAKEADEVEKLGWIYTSPQSFFWLLSVDRAKRVK